jgi:hypothetical protein
MELSIASCYGLLQNPRGIAGNNRIWRHIFSYDTSSADDGISPIVIPPNRVAPEPIDRRNQLAKLTEYTEFA